MFGMGLRAPETKQAWKELNEHFGRCPKCGVDPFVGWDALHSHSSHLKKFYSICVALKNAELIKIGSKTSDITDAGKLAADLVDSKKGSFQRLSEILIDSHSEVANVTINNKKFKCNSCGAVWNPDKWEIDFKDLGFAAYNY